MRSSAIAVAGAMLLAVALLLGSLPGHASSPPAASVEVTVNVPAGMNQPPFHVRRTLQVPPTFSVAVFARVSNARFLAVAPNGDLLVSQPAQGAVVLLRPRANGPPQQFTFASGLQRPHDIVLHMIDGQTYVYIAEKNRISRYPYTSGATRGERREDVVTNLPDESLDELRGAYGHVLKNIAIDRDHKLYVSVASATNADPTDLAAAIKRGAIYTYDARATSDAAQGTLFAQGLRNAEGLAFVPGTDDLWVVVNNRDNIACPRAFTPIPGTTVNCAEGEVKQEYVNNHPPEPFTRVVAGGHYGWPFCNPNPDTGMDAMPFDRDVQTNKHGDKLDCSKANRIDKGIQAHSAPLGLTFLGGTNAPIEYRNGVIVGLHGSWNSTVKHGYKFVYFPWDAAANRPGREIDFVSGFVDGNSAWGRPVDSAVAPDGSIYLSDDYSGTVYTLTSDAPEHRLMLPLLEE